MVLTCVKPFSAERLKVHSFERSCSFGLVLRLFGAALVLKARNCIISWCPCLCQHLFSKLFLKNLGNSFHCPFRSLFPGGLHAASSKALDYIITRSFLCQGLFSILFDLNFGSCNKPGGLYKTSIKQICYDLFGVFQFQHDDTREHRSPAAAQRLQ